MNEPLHQLIQQTLHFTNAGTIPGFTGKLMDAEEYETAARAAFVGLALKDERLRKEALMLVGDEVPAWMQMLNSSRER